MLTSHSTDKLNSLTKAAADMVRSSPELGKRITNFNLTWNEIGGIIVPVVNITFADEPKPPHDPLFQHTQTVHD